MITASVILKSRNITIIISATVGPTATKYGMLAQFDPPDLSVFENRATVVAVFDWFMRLMSRL